MSRSPLPALVAALLLTAASPAQAFFCLMMSALGNGGITVHFGGNARQQPRFQPPFQAGPMGFAPGYGYPPPPWAAPPPWSVAPPAAHAALPPIEVAD